MIARPDPGLPPTLEGELEPFVKKASTTLGDLLAESGHIGKGVTDQWSSGLKRLSTGELFVTSPKPEKPQYDPLVQYSNFFAAALGAMGTAAVAVREKALRELQQKGNALFSLAVKDTDLGKALSAHADSIRSIGEQMQSKLAMQAHAGEVRSIAWLLVKLLKAAQRTPGMAAVTVSGHKTAKQAAQKGKGQLSASSREKTHCADGQCPKTTAHGAIPSAAGASGNSISFATGSETLLPSSTVTAASP